MSSAWPVVFLAWEEVSEAGLGRRLIEGGGEWEGMFS